VAGGGGAGFDDGEVQELVQHVFQALALLGQQGLAGLFGAEIDLLERRHE
jgi:hypothetical protein